MRPFARIEGCAISGPSDGWFHCTIRTVASSEEAAVRLARVVMSMVGAGRTRYVRAAPEGKSDTDFASGKTMHSGYARFAFKDETGMDHPVDTEAMAVTFGPARVP